MEGYEDVFPLGIEHRLYRAVLDHPIFILPSVTVCQCLLPATGTTCIDKVSFPRYVSHVLL